MKKRTAGMPSLIWFMLLVSLVCTGYVRNVLAMEIFSDSFNQGNIGDRYIKHGGCYPYSFTQQDGILRIVNNMWEDNRNCNNTWGKPKYDNGQMYYTRRAELMPKSKSTKSAYNNEYEWIFNLKFVEISLTTAATFFQVISHPFQGFDMALRMDKGNLWAHIRGKSYKIRKIDTGIWMTFSMQFKRSLDLDGYFQLFIDNNLVFSYDGITTQSNSEQTMTKFGLYNGKYHNGGDQTMYELWIDDIRVEQYIEVDDRGDD
jgi:hypothetical protein